MNREVEGKKVRSFGLWLTNGKKKAALSTFLPFLWTLGGKWKTNKKKRANKLHHKERYLMPAARRWWAFTVRKYIALEVILFANSLEIANKSIMRVQEKTAGY